MAYHVLLINRMPSKKNVGGSKGKGPAKRAPAKRPPPTEHACEGEEAISPEALSGFRALLAAVQRGAPPAARAKTASTSNQEDILNAILSRLSAVESVVQQVAAVASHSRAEEPQVTPGAAQAEQQMTEQVVSAQPMGGTEVNPVPQQSAVSMVNPVTSSQVSTETPTTSQQEGDGSAGAAQLGKRRRVLICGHSYIHWAERHASKTSFGQHLGLAADVAIEWRGRRGLRWEGLMPLLFPSGRGSNPPDMLIVHLGGNDLGLLKGKALSEQALADFRTIREAWPHTRLVWSTIIPRHKWPGGGTVKQMDEARRRVNRSMLKAFSEGLGYFIRHPEVTRTRHEFYRADGIHLSDAGNSQFLCDLQAGIRVVLKSWGTIVTK
ncbi:uncharacterized protein [Anolis sagrei]|uniref:uncharacterized protein isoform X3 n=1 Tax=Anolis sagrei TaxID=38937 RepID=UPI003520E752